MMGAKHIGTSSRPCRLLTARQQGLVIGIPQNEIIHEISFQPQQLPAVLNRSSCSPPAVWGRHFVAFVLLVVVRSDPGSGLRSLMSRSRSVSCPTGTI